MHYKSQSENNTVKKLTYIISNHKQYHLKIYLDFLPCVIISIELYQ